MPLKPKKIKLEPIDWTQFHPAPVIGVDEAGRGCLFGPVFAGAVVFKSEAGLELFADSKQIAEDRREEIFDFITVHHFYAVGSASVEEINQINILQAALLAMKRAVHALKLKTGHVLVDGNQKIPNLSDPKLGHQYAQTTIIKGDDRAKPIAAASIVAKVARDRHVRLLAEKFSQYGLEKHKGYATEAHRDAIRKWGPTEDHRKTFAGVREYWNESVSTHAVGQKT